jgi:signal transduction histidine kinase
MVRAAAAESESSEADAIRAVARAHAQKNCAAVILAIARLAAPDLPPRQRERFERLRGAATRLVTLLNEEMREAAAGAAEEAAEVDVAQLVGAARDLVRDRAESGEVALVVSCAGGRMRGDASALTEVLVNLIGNAIDASPAGYSVRVDARIAPAGGQQWIIDDAGVGLPAHVLAGVGRAVRSGRPFGSGFGIALAARTIRAHGGTLRFEPRTPRGTRAVIDLP